MRKNRCPRPAAPSSRYEPVVIPEAIATNDPDTESAARML